MRGRKKKNHKKKYQQTEKVKEIRRKSKSLRENEDTRREKKSKTEIYQKYVYRGDIEIKK